MYVSRRGLGFISIALGVVALIVILRGSFGRGGFGRQERGQRPAAVAPQPQAPQAAGNASPDYLRGYADGLEAGQQQNARQAIPQAVRQERFGGRGGHGGRGGPGWLALLALPLLLLGGLMVFRNGRGRWPLSRGRRDLDRPTPARPEPEQAPYTGETRNF